MGDNFDPDAFLATPDQAPGAMPPPSTPMGGGFDPNAYLNQADNEAESALQNQYGSIGQQMATAAEGGAQAATFGLSTKAETALGVDPKGILLRQQANPKAHFAGQVAGLAASSLIPVAGEANILRGVGEFGAETAAKYGAGKFVQNLVKGVAETALFTAGDKVSEHLAGSDRAVGSALWDIGLASVIGGGLGAGFGAVSPLWKAANESPVAQSIKSFQNRVLNGASDSVADAPLETLQNEGIFNRLSKQKPNAPEIRAAAAENNWPILEGMTSDNKLIQKAEDALLNGPPTLPSIARQDLYNKAYQAVNSDVGDVFGGSAPLSETETGNVIKNSLTQKLSEDYGPIKNLYNEIEPYRQAIPLTDKSTGSIARNVSKLIEEHGLIPGSERYDYVKTMATGLDGVDNLQKLKNFKTELWKSSGPMTKDLAGDISERLEGVEDRAIRRFADTMKSPEAKAKITDLLDQTDQAKAMYKQFRDKLQTLGNSLGKKKIYGPQNFIDFVDEINPQTLGKKIFNPNNTEFAQYFAKEFPEEMQVMRQYQRGLLSDAATKEGQFSAKSAISKALGMQPEMQNILFSPEESKLLNQAKTYLDSFPKNFNPSGTAHESAFRQFFEHPTGATIGNLRDGAIQGFIKLFGKANAGAASESAGMGNFIGKSVLAKEPNAGAFKNAVDFMTASLRGNKAISKATEALLDPGKQVLPASLYVSQKELDKLDRHVEALTQNPSGFNGIAGSLGHYLPDHAQNLTALSANAVNYLKSIKPTQSQGSPLDKPSPVDPGKQQQYQRALRIAQQPLSILQWAKDGTLTSQDIKTLSIINPGAKALIAQRVFDELTRAKSAGVAIPYQTRKSLSLILGQAVDSTMKQSTMATIMMANGIPHMPMQAPHQGGRKAVSQSTARTMEKNNTMNQTPGQARQLGRLQK